MADNEFKIDISSTDILKKIQDGLEVYQKTMSFQVFRALTLLEAQIKQNIRRDSGLHVRTGALLNSVYKKVVLQGNTVIGEVGTQGIPYARIHEFGGTILPVNKKFLAIPSEENRRPDGTPKITTQELMGGLGKSFIMNNVIFLATAAGGSKSKYTKLTPMFYLKKSVTIPKRPYMQPAIAAKQDEILKNFGLFISASFGNKEG